ncbi:FYN-binding protein 2 isoform X2 [Echinops telfairi]|uniref:FYN-binding protein 2 isoform X2 n=1 Tax=Echinops telfairi TaxID=9371 RepID=A0AC55D7E1_ECHTE|nr:FYN-binding protein 2 isoform X2 [Echinops telfairi]
MLQEGVRNFKELRAKFQNTLDAPLLPGPIKPAVGVSHRGCSTSAPSTQGLANGKAPSSNQSRPSPCDPSGECEPLAPQQMKLTQSNNIQKCSNSPAPLEGSSGCAINLQKASLLSEVNHPKDELREKEKVIVAYSFRDKLSNWEKFSTQKSQVSSTVFLTNCGGRGFQLDESKILGSAPEKLKKRLDTNEAKTLASQRHLLAQRKSVACSEESSMLHHRKSLENSGSKRTPTESTVYECELASPVTEKRRGARHHQLPQTKPLPSVKSLGPPPPKPPKPPAVNLLAFRRQAAAVSKTQRKDAVEDSNLPPESAELEDPHDYAATISYLKHSGNSSHLCNTKGIADSTYEVRIEELQKPRKSLHHQELSPDHDCDDKAKKNGPRKSEPAKAEESPHISHQYKMENKEETRGKLQLMKVHRGRRSILARKQDSVVDFIQTKACSEDPALARHAQGHCGYVEALQVTKETPKKGAIKANSTTEQMYDDVASPERERTKSFSSNSFTSDSEESSEETYEDVYKTKKTYSKTDLDGHETIKRLQQFFKKEKARFKMKKAKSKENVSDFSISLPNLEFRSREVIIYDDVVSSERKPKEGEKLKTWKAKFLISKENKGKKAAGESKRHFFRIKKSNLEKKMAKEEKLFRERFEYDKEISVINTAVACSHNSRKGTFDLPITPGEKLDVIDLTEQNLVICRNAEGKYGYVLIEHLDFKHQGWSP